MSEPLAEPSRFPDYLLGRLSDEEQARVEEDLFTRDGAEEALHAATDDLIHAYLANALSADDRARFEAFFLASPPHRQRLAFMRALLEAMERSRAARSRLSRWMLSGALLAAASLAAVVLKHGRGPASAPPPTVSTTAIVRLSGSRPDATAVNVTPHTRDVRIEVRVEDTGASSYAALIRAADGREVWKAEGLAAAAGQPLIVIVPARLLDSQPHALLVQPEEPRQSQLGTQLSPTKLRARKTPRPREYVLTVVRQP